MLLTVTNMYSSAIVLPKRLIVTKTVAHPCRNQKQNSKEANALIRKFSYFYKV